jgi:hypothetical protein
MKRFSELMFSAATKHAIFGVLSDPFKCFQTQGIFSHIFSSYNKFIRTLHEIVVAQCVSAALYVLDTGCNNFAIRYTCQ